MHHMIKEAGSIQNVIHGIPGNTSQEEFSTAPKLQEDKPQDGAENTLHQEETN